MNYTTNFNLNKPEGTDLYNHLTVDNPNMDTIDAAMQANKLASVGAATELVSGTVHAITRADSNQNIFKFKATGDFKAGDTITVDGVSVNAYTTGGQQLINDAYVLSAEVLCILDGASLWILTNAIATASEIAYDANNSIYDVINNREDFKQVSSQFYTTTVGPNTQVMENVPIPSMPGYSLISAYVFITRISASWFVSAYYNNFTQNALLINYGTANNDITYVVSFLFKKN